jgi:hypothetical protein
MHIKHTVIALAGKQELAKQICDALGLAPKKAITDAQRIGFVDVLNGMAGKAEWKTTDLKIASKSRNCPRCGGTGEFGAFGRCFGCAGTRVAAPYEITLATEIADLIALAYGLPTSEDKKTAAAVRKRQAELAVMRGRLAACGLSEMLTEQGCIHPDALEANVAEVLWKAVKWDLSEKQIAWIKSAVERVRTRREEKSLRQATAVPAPEGRVTFTARILTIKQQESQYGVTLKMIVAHEEGWRAWLTLPAAIDNAQVGDVVTMTATLERAQDDATMAWGKRPTNASIKEAANVAA